LPPTTLGRVEAWLDDIQLSPRAAALVEDPPVEPPADQAPTSVDKLLEAFKRLDAQLESILDSLQTYNPRP
jgi:hypothetical protein